jgi:hypothetical protein
MVVSKYEFSPAVFDQPTAVLLPEGFHLMGVEVENGAALLWALVDEKATPKPFWMQIYGTGWHIDQPQQPLDGKGPPALFPFKTVRDGGFAWHVFMENNS